MSADILIPDHINELLSIAHQMGLSRFAAQWQQDFEQTLQNRAIHVIFLGEFNHGKSSLINALIGEDILPYGVTSEKIATWEWSDWRRDSRSKLPDILIKKSADRLDIYLESQAFDRECVFIDTPGLNEASFVRESFLNRYVRKADLLLFLLDANQPMTHTEQDILSQITDALPAQSRAIVINKCDRLDDDEHLEVCHYTESCLALTIANEPFYMISSKKRSGDWNALKARIASDITAGKQSYEARYINKLGGQLQASLEGFYPLYRAIEQLDPPALKSLKKASPATDRQMTPLIIADILHRITQHTAHLKQLVSDDTDRFEQAFLKAIPREINKVFLEDVEKYLEDFIRDAFLEFGKNTYHLVIDSLDTLMHALWHELMPQSPDIPRFEFHLRRICLLLKSPARTGAFDTTDNVAMFFTPVPILLSGRAERPRREVLRNMAENDIHRRADAFRKAFKDELDHQNNLLNELIRDHCHQLTEHIQNIAARLLESPRTDWSEIEAGLYK